MFTWAFVALVTPANFDSLVQVCRIREMGSLHSTEVVRGPEQG